jgi:hypothetical protein
MLHRMTTAALVAAFTVLLAAPAWAQYDTFGQQRYRDPYLGGYDRYPPYPGTGDGGGYELPDRAASYARSRARADSARQLIDEARDRLLNIKRSLLREWSMSSELQSAYQEVSDARQQYQQTRQNALAQLENIQPYREAEAQVQQIDRLIRQLRGSGNPDQQQIVDLANEQLFWLERVGNYKNRVLDNDDMRQARENLVAANQRYERLQDRYLAEVDQAPAVIAARDRVYEAMQQYADVRADLAASYASYREARIQDAARYRDTDNYAPWLYYGYGGYYDGIDGGRVGFGDPTRAPEATGLPGGLGNIGEIPGPGLGGPSGVGRPGTRTGSPVGGPGPAVPAPVGGGLNGGGGGGGGSGGNSGGSQ